MIEPELAFADIHDDMNVAEAPSGEKEPRGSCSCPGEGTAARCTARTT